MEKIFINYEILDFTFIIKILNYYTDSIEYQEKVYKIEDYKDTNKNLYNDILDNFDLDMKFENDKFYEVLAIMSVDIMQKIKDR